MLAQTGPASAPATPPAITVTMSPVPLLPQTVTVASGGTPLTADPVLRAKAGELAASNFDARCLPVAQPIEARTGIWPNCPALLKEDGLLRASVADYHAQPGASDVKAAALEFDDATGAYSAYTYIRGTMDHPKVSTSDVKALASASETSTDPASTTVWAGTAVLHIEGHPSAAQLNALVASLPNSSGRTSLAPLLPTFFPAEGLNRSGIRYALGPVGYRAMGGTLPDRVIDWSRAIEVGMADYAGRGGKGMLTLLMSPTPQIAGAQGRAIEKALNDLPQEERSHFGTVKLRRIGTMVGLTTGSFTSDRAEKLVQALHLSEEVTFDQKMPLEFHAEVQKTASLLENIAAFVGVMVVAAILLALFLGGARAGIRKLQGKPVASEPEFLAINLRGRPAPLIPVTAEKESSAAPAPEPLPPRPSDD
jgi:hypothetical protein